MNGRNSDGGTWAQGPLRKALENNTLNLLKPTPLSGDIPFVCVGDDAFPLATCMMKPYPQKDFKSRQKNFQLPFIPPFGVLANCQRVFCKPFLLKPEKVKVITYSVLLLHNFLRSESTTGKIYIPPNLIDFDDGCGTVIPDDWRKDAPSGTWLDLELSTSRNSSRQAKDVREKFKHFFMNEGSVPWQWKGNKRTLFVI